MNSCLEMSKSVKNRLTYLRSTGFIPRTALDIGAYEGCYSIGFKSIFPESNMYMIEANHDKRQHLEKTGFSYSISLLSDKNKIVPFYKYIGTETTYTTGNSVYKENSKYYQDEKCLVENIKSTPLSDFVRDNKIENIDFIKMDVQGSEKDIVLGGISVIRECKYVQLEISIVEYNDKSPLIYEMFELMKTLGFSVNDILEVHYIDGRLIQIDILFKNDYK